MGTASIPTLCPEPQRPPQGQPYRVPVLQETQQTGSWSFNPFPWKIRSSQPQRLRVRVMSSISIIQSASDLPASPPRLIVLGAIKVWSQEAGP